MRIFSRLALLAFLLLPASLLAAPPDEGMWLPLLLKQLNEADMQKKGLKLTAEQIYSIYQGSLKDATTGAAVVGAEVFLPTLGRTLRSDATGSFAALVKPGRYNATLRAPGYVAQRKLLVLQPGDSMVLNVDFEPVPASAP